MSKPFMETDAFAFLSEYCFIVRELMVARKQDEAGEVKWILTSPPAHYDLQFYIEGRGLQVTSFPGWDVFLITESGLHYRWAAETGVFQSFFYDEHSGEKVVNREWKEK